MCWITINPHKSIVNNYEYWTIIYDNCCESYHLRIYPTVILPLYCNNKCYCKSKLNI